MWYKYVYVDLHLSKHIVYVLGKILIRAPKRIHTWIIALR